MNPRSLLPCLVLRSSGSLLAWCTPHMHLLHNKMFVQQALHFPESTGFLLSVAHSNN